MKRDILRTLSGAVTFMFTLTLLPQASATTAALYGADGNDLYRFTGGDTVANLRSSGWTTLILFAATVQPNGDITIENGNTKLVQNGVYVGDSNWGANVAAVKTAPRPSTGMKSPSAAQEITPLGTSKA